MPKSGTWYTRYFFHFLTHLLRGDASIPVTLENSVAAGPIPELGLDCHGVFHSAFPEFDKYRGPYQASWQNLQYHLAGYDMAGPLMRQEPARFLASHNPNARFVYLVRNPLDQTVSFFHHGLKHTDPTALLKRNRDGEYVRNADGSLWKPASPKEFLRHNLESYLKQYLTWHLSADLFPKQIKIVHYAELTRAPERTFSAILEFLNCDSSQRHFDQCFQQAIKLSSKNNIRSIEEKIGHALGNDQQDRTERHVRDGRIGKWQEHFDDEDLTYLKAELAKWGLSPKHFTLH